MIQLLRVAVRVAARNLFYRRANLLIGAVVFFAILALGLGNNLLASMQVAMGRSISETAAGDVQIFSSASKDLLDGFSDPTDLHVQPLTNFPRIRRAIEQVDNVQAVLPNGMRSGTLVGGNPLDRKLANLRAVVREDAASPTHAQQLQERMREVRSSVDALAAQLERARLSFAPAEWQADRALLEKATSAAFWDGFAAAPDDALEFLENNISPLAGDELQLTLTLLGTDSAEFRKNFPRLQVVQGTMIPDGQRGLMIPKGFYEDNLKLRSARDLDKIQEGLKDGRHLADDSELQRLSRQARAGVPELLLELPTDEAPAVAAAVAARLKGKPLPIQDALEALLTFDDSTFQAHRDAFYALVAPHLNLYRIHVGDLVALKSRSDSGYETSTLVKLYGIFQFRGFEHFPLLERLSLVDLVSFRELYGFPTPEEQADRAALTASEPVDVSQAALEQNLGRVGTVPAFKLAPSATANGISRREAELALLERHYTPEEMDSGVALSAVVVLKDPSRAQETLAKIRARIHADGLPVVALPWQQVVGVLGQIFGIIRYVLLGFGLILFLIMALLINNSTVIGTLQRVPEFGTLRAMGAQRGFVFGTVLLEAVILCLVAAIPAVILAAVIIHFLGQAGLPSPVELINFFFGGPRLFPTLAPLQLLLPVLLAIVVTAGAAIYPALLATRISPVKAMQHEE